MKASSQTPQTQGRATRRSTSARKIRYAVVGLGHIAQVAVLPAFRTARNSELVALISGDSEKLKKLGKKYGVKNLYSYEEYEQALPTVDAVYIAMPNHLHREYAVRALNAGVHVLCEKPMAVNEEECQAMIDAAEEKDLKLMIAYRLHLEAGNLEAIRLAQSRKLGNLRVFTSEFAQQVASDNLRVEESSARGGGPLFDMGVYCINAARYLFRSEAIEVLALNASNDEARFHNVEEMTSVIMLFPEERVATFTCSFGATDISRFTLIGSEGSLTAEPAYEYSTGIRHRVTIAGKTKTRNFPKRDQFAAELVYFSQCILEDREPEPSGLEGIADVRIIQAIYESARSGQTVKVPSTPLKSRPTEHQEIHRPAHDKPKTVHAKSPSGEAA